MTDYSFGVNFLRSWYNSGFRSVLTFAGVLAKFSNAQIESIGKFARILPTSRWGSVFTLANKDYTGASVPSKSAFNSYFLAVGGDIDYGKIAKEVALETFDLVGMLSKYGLGIAVIVGVGAVLIFANSSGKTVGSFLAKKA
jgi:hypothetical protein